MLLHCGYVLNHISCWHVCLTVGTLMDCIPALNLPKCPDLIEFSMIARYVVAFRMVKPINSPAEKTRSTQFCRLDMMLTEYVPLFFFQTTISLHFISLLWFVVGLDSITQIYHHQINNSWNWLVVAVHACTHTYVDRCVFVYIHICIIFYRYFLILFLS